MSDEAPTFNVEQQAEALLQQARDKSAGRAARHLSGGPESTMTHTVIALVQGSTLAEHENPGEATVLVLSGDIRLDSESGSAEGHQGDLLIIPPERHSLAALTDSAVMLTAVKLHAH